MNKLTHWINRFPYKHPNFGIPNLMKYLVLGNVAIFLLYVFSDYNYSAISVFFFDWNGILRGELWRLVTFMFIPSTFSAFSFAISTYLYYFIGNVLERDWGTGRFTLYFFSGVLLSLVGMIILSLLYGSIMMPGGTYYVYISMFMAFAMLYPENRMLLFFVIPIKMKYLAVAGAVMLGYNMLSGLLSGSMFFVIMPALALLNFVIFFWEQITGTVGYYQKRSAHQNSAQTIHFKTAAKRQAQQQKKQGYRHKCEACGRTDTDNPSLQFRYCSRCSGYHCFCEDHIANHEHHSE